MIYKTSLKLLLVLILLISITSCDKQKVILPAVTNPSTNKHFEGNFVWHDLLTDDVERAKDFYGSLFNWKFETSTFGEKFYVTIKHDGNSIGGIIYVEELEEEVEYSQWVGSLSVADVDKAADIFKAADCEFFIEPTDYSNRGRLALVRDPQGAILSILKSSTGDPEREPIINRWLWNDLWTDDIEGAVTFYNNLVGFEKKSLSEDANSNYSLFTINEKPKAGLIKIPFPNVRPNWVPYIAVDNAKEIINKAIELGGRILLEPEGVREGKVAIIADPTGAAFTVQQWPLTEEERSIFK